MKYLHKIAIGAFSLGLILGGGGEASAQSDNQTDKTLRKDRLKIALDVGGIGLNAATFNPVGVMVSTASLGWHSYQYGKHQQTEQGSQAGAAQSMNDQPESLVAIADRPGYYYYPSNPNQIYYDASAVATPDPMPARIPEKPPISVLIANTSKDGRTIHYSVSGTPYAVPPGYIQVLTAPAGSIIAYDRGGETGSERFTLTSGNYEFRTTDQGWRFYATPPPSANVAKTKDATKPPVTSKPAVIVR